MAENPTVVFSDVGTVEIDNKPVPDVGPNQVLIQTDRTLVSTGTELTALSGEFPEGSGWDEYIEYPTTPGYDNVGTVVEVGDEVEEIEVGQRVGTYGSHAKYVAMNAESCRPIPDDVTDDEAVFFTIAEIVMNGVRRGDVTWGEATVVYGLGLLGQLTAQICHTAGARPVVGVDLADTRLSYLPDAPGVIPVNPSDEDPQTIVEEATDGRLADVVFEVTGNPDVITTELEVLREQGRFVILSSPRGETTLDFHDHCNAPSYRIIGAHNSSHPPVSTPEQQWTNHRHAALFFDYLAEGTLATEPLISHSEPYNEAPRLYNELLEDRTDAMGVVMEWD